MSFAQIVSNRKEKFQQYLEKVYGKRQKGEKKEQKKEEKELTTKDIADNIIFSSYFKDCDNVTKLKSVRKDCIQNINSILLKSFRNEEIEESTQLSDLAKNYDKGDIGTLETFFIEKLDTEYAALIKTFKKKPSKKRKLVDTEKSKNTSKRQK